MGLGQFADLRGGTSQERGGGVFEGGRGWYPNAHYECYIQSCYLVQSSHWPAINKCV